MLRIGFSVWHIDVEEIYLVLACAVLIAAFLCFYFLSKMVNQQYVYVRLNMSHGNVVIVDDNQKKRLELEYIPHLKVGTGIYTTLAN